MFKQPSIKGKILRLLNARKPVSKDRTGTCLSCGKCCKFLITCPFLNKLTNRCTIYAKRPLACQKYPRCRREQESVDGCGFHFNTTNKH